MQVGPLLTVAFLFASHARSAPGSSPSSACDRAYENVQHIAREEGRWDYAREVLVESRKTFVRECERHLSPREVKCLQRAQTSRELYDCT